MPPFIIYALPRSRTFWLSRFLTYGDWTCGHDEVRHARSLDDVKAWFSQPCTGTVETAGASWWRLVQRYCPDVRSVVIRRPVGDVIDSLMAIRGVTFDEARLVREIRCVDRKLDQIERRVPGVLSVQFSDLQHEDTCAAIFRHCLPYQHDPAWFSRTAALNLQISMPAMARYCVANRAALEKLRLTAKHRSLAHMAREPASVDGMTIQQEPFDDAYRDGQRLFAEHLTQVGEAPTAFAEKNLPLMRALEGMGCLQVTTARSNGRMFGYLMAVIGPSLELRDQVVGTHTTFFLSPDAPPLAIKLQRASVEALRRRGVDKVDFMAGTRGCGPKMGALYRRMGAERVGEAFSLNLGAG